jgi:hypothetical protein
VRKRKQSNRANTDARTKEGVRSDLFFSLDPGYMAINFTMPATFSQTLQGRIGVFDSKHRAETGRLVPFIIGGVVVPGSALVRREDVTL